MFELSQIILWILWRLRPAMAVEANLVDIIASGFRLFTNDNALAQMEHDQSRCLIVSAGLADAHTKLDLLIYLRACEIAGVRSRAKDFVANRTASRSGRTPQACWTSFRRLVTRFEDRERLAQRRAERMQRERCTIPLRLDASHQSTSPALRAGEDTHDFLASLSAQHWGRWIGASSRRDGGGSLHARGPPTNPDCPFPVTHLSRSATENAPACQKLSRACDHPATARRPARTARFPQRRSPAPPAAATASIAPSRRYPHPAKEVPPQSRWQG